MTEITGRLRDVRGTHVEEFSVEGAPPRGLRQYRPDRVRVEFTSFAPVGGDRPSGVKVTLFGPVLKKDGTDSKRRTSEVFLTRRVTSVPTWVWDVMEANNRSLPGYVCHALGRPWAGDPS